MIRHDNGSGEGSLEEDSDDETVVTSRIPEMLATSSFVESSCTAGFPLHISKDTITII